MRFYTLFLAVSLLFVAQNAAAQTKLLRFPTVNQNSVVFSYAGDLYTAPRGGGGARKLTNHEGYECFARFSADGKQLAFTGQYDGNTEVFLMPAEGGEPKRLTYTATLGRDDVSDRMGPNNIVLGWRNDGAGVVFRSRRRAYNDFKGELYYANPAGGEVKQLPFSVGGFCSFSPDDQQLAYNRVFREFRTWKYYKGGMADDIFIYDFKTGKSENITNTPNQDICPMWHENYIYFISDRDRTMNLFRYDLKTKETKKITTFKDYDVKFPSKGSDAIVFENGGEIWLYNLQTEKLAKIEIQINDDFNSGRPVQVDASKLIDSYTLSPDGARVGFGARGEIFSLPVKTGVARQLTRSSGSHERNVDWSADGKWIAYISDASGEDEIYIAPQDGSAPATQLTTEGNVYKYNIVWSPDSKKILWADRAQRLRYVDVATKEITEVDNSNVWEIRSYTWSPDSRWIAYVKAQWQSEYKIWVFDTQNNEKQPVTEKWYGCGSPTFSDDGKYLFFTSNRDFSPIYSQTEWNTAYTDMTQVFFVTLKKNTPSPFAPENNETNAAKPKEEKKDEAKIVSVEIDFDGIEGRTLALPIAASNYWNISTAGNLVYYQQRSSKEKKSKLKVFDLKEKKETELGEFDGYILSQNREKMLVAAEGKYAVVSKPTDKIAPKDYVDLSGLKTTVNRREEWRQIYFEAWRQMRDFFYHPLMHGVDWPAMRDKYAALLPYVNHRSDLSYIIGELIGELNCGHAYVGNGDAPKPARIPMGLLGAVLERDASGSYKITRILKGANWSKDLRSPLTEIGVDVKEGDYITAVNGVSTASVPDIYALLIDKAEKQIQLTVSSSPDGAGARQALVVPIADESSLYYYNWVQKNIDYVSQKTNGKVGYIHVPDMSAVGLNEFVKHFYPQLDKEALIIDDRGNGAGNVSPMILERLRREMDMITISRNNRPSPHPNDMMIGPKLALIDRYSASDGDLFAYRFKKYGLGKIVGVRSWGGTVGIRGSLPFVDGGSLNKPEFSRYDTEGKTWIIEGYGVDPDIVIDNDPAREYQGFDDQLDRAIEEMVKDMKKAKTTLPNPPTGENKSR